MLGHTTRTMTFTYTDPTTTQVSDYTKIPAGTLVHVHERRDGRLTLRLPGTLLERRQVTGADVNPA